MDHPNLQVDLAQMPWPDDNSHVFVRGESGRRVVWLPKDAAQWHRYACGYKEAAERVYESWVVLSDDSLVFPIVFLYRHYVELRLKELLHSAERYLDLARGWEANHDIRTLWEHLGCLLPEIFPNESEANLKSAGRLLLELAKVDPFSFQFRYPESTRGQKHLDDFDRLDVVSFIDAMRRLSAFLDGASMALSVYTETLKVV